MTARRSPTTTGIRVKCREHPRYQARRKPRVDCGTCELMWDLANGGNIESEALDTPRKFSKLVIA